VLDNCEQVIDTAARLASALLAAAAGLRIIATSREPLRLPGEQVYPLLPLPVPDCAAGLEALMRSTAVRLFVDRAQRHRPSFELDARNAVEVAQLVARLEGIPLALELAAARVRSLSVADINARLKDRYKLLTGGGHVLLERQQTLRALVDWSYDLLSEHERIALARLSVFAGGFDLAAAEAVCGTDPLDSADFVDLLSSLVEKSLVMSDEQSDRGRYRMLETIRDYARQKLELAADAGTIVRRHCEHYFELAKAANRGLSEEPALWTRRVEAELDNIRAAIALALAGGVDPVIAVKIAVAMQNFWMFGGRSAEGRAYIRTILELKPVQASDLALGFALYVGGALALDQGDPADACRLLENCLALRRAAGNEVNIAATLSTLSGALLQRGDAIAARECEAQAIAIFRRLEDRTGEAIGYEHLAQICLHGDDVGEAREHLDRCLAIARAIGHMELQMECEQMLGEIALAAGDRMEASRRIMISLRIAQDVGDRRGEVVALWWMGKVDLEAGNLPSARIRLAGALRLFQAFEMHAAMLDCVEDFAALVHRTGDLEHAVRLCGASARSRDRNGVLRKPAAERRWRDTLTTLRRKLPDPTFTAAWSDGQAWEVDEAARRILSTIQSPATLG